MNENIKISKDAIYATGKRKDAVARVWLKPGSGRVLINGKNSEAYNIGIEEPEISIKDLAKIMIQVAEKNFNYNGILEFKNNTDKNYLIDNPNRRCPSIAKARQEVGYNPNITLEEGLYRSLYWYYNFEDY